MTHKTWLWPIAVGAGVLGITAIVVERVWAGGVPTTAALTYSGTLQDADGAPLTQSHEIEVKLWAAASGGTDALCESGSQAVDVQAGRFSLELPGACSDAVKAHADTWAEVWVDGSSLGRAKLGAVPYALEANAASTATGALAQQIVPAGAVLPFDLDACPAGWSEFAAAHGRAIIGTTDGLTRGTAVGSNSVALSVGQLPTHTHAGTTGPGNRLTYRVVHQVGASTGDNHATGWMGGPSEQLSDTQWSMAAHTHDFTTAATGLGEPFDNRQESLSLLYCRKD